MYHVDKDTQIITVPELGPTEVNKATSNNMWYVFGIVNDDGAATPGANVSGVIVSWEPEIGWHYPYNFSYNNYFRKHLPAIGKEILANPYFLKKFLEWKKNAMKRLEKSVPRLKEEYENSHNRLEKFKSFVP